MRESPFSDPADRAAASHTPDIAREIDDESDGLVEAFMESMRARGVPALPRTWMEFQLQVRGLMAAALADETDGFTKTLAAMRERNVSEAQQEAVIQTMALVLDRGDGRKMAADSIAFAAGLHCLQFGKSQVELGDESDVGRAAISKRVTATQRSLGLPPSRGCKDDEARDEYQRREHEMHGTEIKEITKECRLLATAVKRLTSWLLRIVPDMREAIDGESALNEVKVNFDALRVALDGYECCLLTQ